MKSRDILIRLKQIMQHSHTNDLIMTSLLLRGDPKPRVASFLFLINSPQSFTGDKSSA